MRKYFFDTAAFLLSLVALGFSLYTYNRHQHQLLEDKQIDAVVELVGYIQECKLSILFTPEAIKMDRKEAQVYTFFELADTTIRSDMNNAPIYFSSGERLPIDFTPYINNPLIPAEIAIKLRDYYRLDAQQQSRYNATMMSNVFVTRFETPESMRMANLDLLTLMERDYGLDKIDLDFDGRFYTMRHVPAFRSFGQFKANNLELYDIIVNWFHEKGMDNVNIPMDTRLYERRKYVR